MKNFNIDYELLEKSFYKIYENENIENMFGFLDAFDCDIFYFIYKEYLNYLEKLEKSKITENEKNFYLYYHIKNIVSDINEYIFENLDNLNLNELEGDLEYIYNYAKS